MDETVREHLGRVAFEAGEKYMVPRRREIYGYDVEGETWDGNEAGRERYRVMAEAVVTAYTACAMETKFSPVLATCHIQPLNQAFENTFPRLSLLADSPEGE